MNDEKKRKLADSMFKKAVGYEAVETQEEYSLVDGEMTLVKRKITKKDVSPDISALKLLLESCEPEKVSIDELERERKELKAEFFKPYKKRV